MLLLTHASSKHFRRVVRVQEIWLRESHFEPANPHVRCHFTLCPRTGNWRVLLVLSGGVAPCRIFEPKLTALVYVHIDKLIRIEPDENSQQRGIS